MKEKSIFIDIPLKVGFDTIILSQSTKERSSLNRIEEKSEKSRFFVVLFVLFLFCNIISSWGQNAKLWELITNVGNDISTN